MCLLQALLVWVDSAKENEFLGSLHKDNDEAWFWIGANRTGNESSFVPFLAREMVLSGAENCSLEILHLRDILGMHELEFETPDQILTG